MAGSDGERDRGTPAAPHPLHLALLFALALGVRVVYLGEMRGSPLLVSPRDFALILAWFEEGIPAALVTDAIVWKTDPDFGYEIVDADHPANAALVEAVGAEILNPVKFYERTGQQDAYRAWVGAMKSERRAFLEGYAVDSAIIAATVG